MPQKNKLHGAARMPSSNRRLVQGLCEVQEFGGE